MDPNTRQDTLRLTLPASPHLPGRFPGFQTAEERYMHRSPWNMHSNLRVDLAAGSTYLLGPFSALLFLALEKDNDFVRFHAYQSALVTTPLVIIRLLVAFFDLPRWSQDITTITLIAVEVFMALRAFQDADSHDLRRFQLPVLGVIAERWVAED